MIWIKESHLLNGMIHEEKAATWSTDHHLTNWFHRHPPPDWNPYLLRAHLMFPWRWYQALDWFLVVDQVSTRFWSSSVVRMGWLVDDVEDRLCSTEVTEIHLWMKFWGTSCPESQIFTRFTFQHQTGLNCNMSPGCCWNNQLTRDIQNCKLHDETRDVTIIYCW